ncbi:MAG: Uma2 family endonuclease [Acidobacteriota bacterium]|nr:Uma2 family endonuclease [Acidobacteriota bacterium]
MSTQTLNLHEIVEHLPTDSRLTLYGIGWDEYEALLNQVGEARGLRISYDDGTLQIMTTSSAHENYAWFIGSLVGAIRLRLRINIRFFGSATMKKQKARKGLEPDACFYVQSAPLIGNRMQLDFTSDPPPDIAVEIDIHHGSISKFPIYAALGVPEIWRYDGEQLTIHLLEQDSYVATETSRALPMLTSHVLIDFLTRLREEGEFQTILAFDEWLQTQQ